MTLITSSKVKNMMSPNGALGMVNHSVSDFDICPVNLAGTREFSLQNQNLLHDS